jgi:tetratricopeptide (TPR) repeat protein
MGATTRLGAGIGVLVVGLALVVGTDARGADDEKNPLREELLKLNQATTKEIQSVKLKNLLKDREKAKKVVAEAVKIMKEAGEKKEKPLNYNALLILSRASMIAKENDAAEKLSERLIEAATDLKSGSKMLEAYYSLVTFYIATKRYNDAIDTCEKALDLTEPMDLVQRQGIFIERMIQAKALAGKTDEALNMIKGLMAQNRNNWPAQKLQGWVEREAGNIDEAIKTYQDVLEKIESDKRLSSEEKAEEKDTVRYTLSGLFVENKQIDKAAEQLQALIKRNPEAATYKNDLGFIWCDHDMKLDESEKLIREALELDKKAKQKEKEEGKRDEVTENAAYLDSMGWVLFKKKKYKEALEYLKKAAADEDDGNHLEIWDHLGDCHMALGQKAEAIAAWEKALKMEDISKRDGERRRKVSEKLRDAKAAKG